MTMSRALAAVLSGLTIGCSLSKATGRVTARIDTLPSGVVQVTSDQPTGWTDSGGAWTITEATRYGAREGAGELIEPGSIGLDGAGRLYVVDRKPAVVKVYDSTGTFLRTIGREGSGPGEFRIGFLAVRGGQVVIHDPMQSRTSVFDTSGKFVKSWKSSCCYWDDITIDQADRVYIPSMNRPDSTGKNPGRAFVRYRLTGELIDTLLVPVQEDRAKEWRFSKKAKDGKGMSVMSTSVPYSPVAVQTFHPEGGFVTGWSGNYRLFRSPRGNDTTRVMTRRWTPDPIPDPLRQARVAEMVKNAKDMVGEADARAIARLDDVPKTAPAFTTLRVDDSGYIWARRLIGSDSTQATFDVFEPGGAWLGAIRVPVGVPEYGGYLFAAGDLYTTTEGDDGRPVIVRLRIGRPVGRDPK